MHIRDIIQPIANQYVATIDLDRGNDHPVSPVEEEKLRQFGQLRVNIGGTLSPEEGDDLVLGNRYMYLPRDFPLQQVFSIDDHGTLAAEYAQLAEALAENMYMNGEVVRMDAAIRMAPK